MKKVRIFLMITVICGLLFAQVNVFAGEGKCSHLGCEGLNKVVELKKELDSTEEQVKNLKELRFNVKKLYIEKKAQLDIIKLELAELLSEYRVDEKKVEKKVDMLYEIKKDLKKDIINAQMKLRAILSKEQFDILKEKKTQQCMEIKHRGWGKFLSGGSRMDAVH